MSNQYRLSATEQDGYLNFPFSVFKIVKTNRVHQLPGETGYVQGTDLCIYVTNRRLKIDKHARRRSGVN